MIRRFLEIITALILTSCIGKSVVTEHSLLLKQIISEKTCVTFYNGDNECLALHQKKIYILPHLDTLKDDNFVKSTKRTPEFIKLQDDFNATDSINKSFGLPLEIETKKIKANFVFKEKDADVVISFTQFFNIDGNKYCVVQIRDGVNTWVLKAVNKNGIFYTELNLWNPLTD